MKITDKQKGLIRFSLWIVSLAWGGFFLVYALLLMPAFMEIVKRFSDIAFTIWASGVFYVLCTITVVCIFFWFTSRLFRKGK